MAQNDLTKIRNLAIIAHVDHGKTTLIDGLLRQAQQSHNQHTIGDRVMDSNDLEKERGITILAKCTGLAWKDFRYNIIDTPGHADFGGEVERILSMVDGVLLLVDAAEGPMPQTKFVTQKALDLGLRPMVIINKIDKNDARPSWVVDQVFDLFADLGANEEQLDFPVLYASAKEGWALLNEDDEKKDFSVLLDQISLFVPHPQVSREDAFSMTATILEKDAYLGRILTGKVHSGSVKVGDSIKGLNANSDLIENVRVTKILCFEGTNRIAQEQAFAGDIIALAGAENTTVSDTLCAPSVTTALPTVPITPPTMSITVGVNTSPIAGRDGKKLTSPMIEERLLKEAESNIAIEIVQSSSKDTFEVRGRGELQLGVLIETMRREGFELTVGPPQILLKKEADGLKEPIEEVQIDVDDEYSGIVIEKLSIRKGILSDMSQMHNGKTRIRLLVPSRGLIGYQSIFLSDTRGTGIWARSFHSYDDYKGDIPKRREGVLISGNTGKSVAYALWNLEERGPLFVGAGTDVYEGMIIGEHNKGNDLVVNPLKGKQLTNMRASGKDEAVALTTPRSMTLEEAISYIAEDECVEVTPQFIRLRKKYLTENERKVNKKNT